MITLTYGIGTFIYVYSIYIYVFYTIYVALESGDDGDVIVLRCFFVLHQLVGISDISSTSGKWGVIRNKINSILGHTPYKSPAPNSSACRHHRPLSQLAVPQGGAEATAR